MSQRVSTNTGHRATRQLPLRFAGSACGTADPNTLNANVPAEGDAMGVSDSSGVITLIHDSGATRQFTIYYWNALVNAQIASKGWIKLGPAAAIYTASVDPYAGGSFSVPESVPFFIVADVAVTNLWLGGCKKHPAQATADIRGKS